jgi:hypothetical protein
MELLELGKLKYIYDPSYDETKSATEKFKIQTAKE